jgi:hypothetical protein
MVDVKTGNFESFHEYMEMRPVRRAMRVAFVQGLLGIGAATLAVIGLQHFAAPALLAIATIVVGAALLFDGGAMAARYSTLASRTEKIPFRLRPWASPGFVAGLGGIVLGILALLEFAPRILIPIAAMALGIAQVMNSGLNARLNAMELSGFKSESWDPEGVGGIVTPYAGLPAAAGPRIRRNTAPFEEKYRISPISPPT